MSVHSTAINVEIEAALLPLLGEPLTDMWRYAGFQRFEFGVQRPAEKGAKGVTHSDWGFVVGCDWQISGPDGVIVSAADFGNESRTDDRAYPFYKLLADQPPVLQKLEAEANGALRFEFSGDYLLEVTPEDTAGDDEPSTLEHWLFLPRDRRKTRYTLYGDGLERWRSKA